MLKRFIVFLLVVMFSTALYSQAYFTSNSNGAWENPANWTLVSGTSGSNYPVAGDSAVIQAANSIQVNINSACQDLVVKGGSTLQFVTNSSILSVSNGATITEASFLMVNAGAFTITGNVGIDKGSLVTQNGGAISIIGLLTLTAPTSTGSTIFNSDMGIFSCLGGLILSGFPSSRIAELRIGNSAVNVAGVLTVPLANGKINFTGSGTLTLAGSVLIPNSASFSAGNGRVVYVGIPGNNQTISPQTYNRLVITGGGNGSKSITGTVTVTDTLSLLSDTLQLTGGGLLRLNNNATIIKTAGKILSAPTFLGQVDLLYNNVAKDTMGMEMPAATNVLRNLSINDISGITLTGNVTVNNLLNLQNGELSTGAFALSIANTNGGVGVDPAIARTNGFVNGRIIRNIGTTGGVRIFPVGVAQVNGYREFKIDYTVAPTTGGTLTVEHFNSAATSQSGFPLLDATVILMNAAPFYWQADAGAGLTGGNYLLTLTAENTPGVTDFSSLRIIKRPSVGGAWTLNGTAGINGGTNSAPIVLRNMMAGFSQFTIAGNSANPLPLKLLNFTGTSAGSYNLLKWTTTSEINTLYFAVERSVDGLYFVETARVNAVNSLATTNNYQYEDNAAQGRKSYYRLRMVDIDGKYTYSKILAINPAAVQGFSIVPTIVHSMFNLISNDNLAVWLYNSNGQLMMQLQVGVNDISRLSNGVYFVKSGLKIVRIVKE